MILHNFLSISILDFVIISEKGDYNRLLFFGFLKYVIPKFILLRQLKSRWAKIYNEYIKKYGLNEDYKKWILYNFELRDLYIEKAKKGDGYINTLIKMKKIDISDIEKRVFNSREEGKNTELSVHEKCADISKFIGAKIRADKTGIDEYYSYINLIQKSK